MTPFFHYDRVKSKLLKNYNKHGFLIVACDWDDTIFNYSNIPGADNTEIISLLKKCKKLNFKIVIYTVSSPERYSEIYNYCEKIGLKIDGINVHVGGPKFDNAKLYYNILLDDKSGLLETYFTLKNIVDYLKNKHLQKTVDENILNTTHKDINAKYFGPYI
jgi:hypothetical protein